MEYRLTMTFFSSKLNEWIVSKRYNSTVVFFTVSKTFLFLICVHYLEAFTEAVVTFWISKLLNLVCLLTAKLVVDSSLIVTRNVTASVNMKVVTIKFFDPDPSPFYIGYLPIVRLIWKHSICLNNTAAQCTLGLQPQN